MSSPPDKKIKPTSSVMIEGKNSMETQNFEKFFLNFLSLHSFLKIIIFQLFMRFLKYLSGGETNELTT